MNTPNPSDLDKVLEKINEIAKKSEDGDYIYRGEPALHEEAPYNGKVSSGLYRPFLEKGQTDVNVSGIQQQILMQARQYIPDEDEMDDLKLSATLQHFGAKTNCTATGNLDHSLSQECGIRTLCSKRKNFTSTLPKTSMKREPASIYYTGVSLQTPPFGVRGFDTYGMSTTHLILTLRNCGLNTRMHFTISTQSI